MITLLTYHFSNHVILSCKQLHLEESEGGIDGICLVDDSSQIWVLVHNDLSDQVLIGKVFILEVHVCDMSDGSEG